MALGRLGGDLGLFPDVLAGAPASTVSIVA